MTTPKNNAGFTVGDVTATTTTAQGVITEKFGGQNVTIDVTVVGAAGSLKIDSITCSPALTAQKGGS